MKLPALLILAALVPGCQPPASSPSPKPVTADVFIKFANSTSDRADALLRRVESLEREQKEGAWQRDRYRIVDLDLTGKGYSVVETSLGKLIVMDAEAAPYLDGFSIRFSVGNPLSINLHGLTLTTRWGPTLDFKSTNSLSAMFEAHERAQHTNTVEVTETFAPGTKTVIELKVTPADATTIKNLQIELQPKQVSLKEAAKR
jgi:hypothetical protein